MPLSRRRGRPRDGGAHASPSFLLSSFAISFVRRRAQRLPSPLLTSLSLSVLSKPVLNDLFLPTTTALPFVSSACAGLHVQFPSVLVFSEPLFLFFLSTQSEGACRLGRFTSRRGKRASDPRCVTHENSFPSPPRGVFCSTFCVLRSVAALHAVVHTFPPVTAYVRRATQSP